MKTSVNMMRKRRHLTWLILALFITHYVKRKKKLNVKDSARIKLLILKKKIVQTPLYHFIIKGNQSLFLSSVWASLSWKGPISQ